MQTSSSRKYSFKFQLIVASLGLLLLSGGFLHAQIQDRPKPTPEQAALQVWVGQWKYEGTLKETPLGPGGKFAGRQTAQMILDGLFLESRAESKGVYGGKPSTYKAVHTQWYDFSTKTYLERAFDNDGFAISGETTVTGDAWTSTSTAVDSKGQKTWFKSVSTFSAGGRTCTTKGEVSTDGGKTWQPLWDQVATKLGK